MNADRMIAVFLAGVLVGGTTVYLSPNNSLSAGMTGGRPAGFTGANGAANGGPGGASAGASTGTGTTAPAGGTDAAGAGGAAPEAGGGPAGGQAGAGTPGGGATGPQGGGAPAMGEDGAGGMGGGMAGMGEGMGGQMGGQMGGEVSSPEGGSTGEAISAVPASGAPKGATRLLRHLQVAPTLWKAQADAASASKDAAVRALGPRIAEHVTNIPAVADRMPPNTEIVSYLVDSKLLLERMKLAGMDVSSLETQVDEVSRSRR